MSTRAASTTAAVPPPPIPPSAGGGATAEAGTGTGATVAAAAGAVAPSVAAASGATASASPDVGGGDDGAAKSPVRGVSPVAVLVIGMAGTGKTTLLHRVHSDGAYYVAHWPRHAARMSGLYAARMGVCSHVSARACCSVSCIVSGCHRARRTCARTRVRAGLLCPRPLCLSIAAAPRVQRTGAGRPRTS